MAETEEALRAEVSRVCRNYCLQVWNEALNQVGVESVYYSLAIRASSSSSSKADTPLEVGDLEKNSPNKVPSSSGNPPKVVEQPGENGKEIEMTKGVAPNATKPLVAP